MDLSPGKSGASLARPAPTRSPFDRYFYPGMALLLAVVVAVGFGPTLDERLFHPPSLRPRVLYVHAAVFTAWILLFNVQAGLIASGRVAWHRRLGLCGVVLGALIPLVGITTVLAITRLNIAQDSTHAEQALIVPFFDMLAFSVTFGLAVWWRRRPEYHRRLMLIASCGLTVAALARFPDWLVPRDCFYPGVDLLILIGVARDAIIDHRVHPVYRFGLPAIMLGQATTMWILVSGWPGWIAVAHAILR